MISELHTIFGNVRASISKGEKPSTCYFCNTETDSATHQIEQCTEVEENTHRELLTQLNSPGASGNIIKDLIFPLNDRVQLAMKQIFNETNLQFIFINQLIGQNIINTLLLI